MTLRYFFGGRIMDIRIGYLKKIKLMIYLFDIVTKNFKSESLLMGTIRHEKFSNK